MNESKTELMTIDNSITDHEDELIIGVEIKPSIWDHALKQVHSSSICVTMQSGSQSPLVEKQARLYSIYPDTDSNCANLGHTVCFWCHSSTLVAIFGVLPTGHPPYFTELVAFFSLLVRCAILFHWKKPHTPSHSQWINSIL